MVEIWQYHMLAMDFWKAELLASSSSSFYVTLTIVFAEPGDR